MLEIVDEIFTEQTTPHLNMLFLVGLALFGGTVGGRLFQKFRAPQVVGYVVAGVVVGHSGLRIVDQDLLLTMQPFSNFALGLIGLTIGSELKLDTLRRRGRQFLYILLGEGLAAFVAVCALTILVGSYILDDFRQTIALGLILGAIASATAPAATTDVLWEHRTRGPLTTMILGIVALDDALSLMLFALASGAATVLMGTPGSSLLPSLIEAVYSISGSVIIGVLFGIGIGKLLMRAESGDRTLAGSLGSVMLLLGLAQIGHLDMLLAAMALGATIANFSTHKSREIFGLVSQFTPPIYVLFFVLFGAKLELGQLGPAAMLLAAAYLIGRTGGKMVGARMGARISGAPEMVRKYLPFCLFSQAGVAIGLSVIAGQRFPDPIGSNILAVITATTFIVQILGPPATKWAVTRAGEVGMNVTREDVLAASCVSDVMDRSVPTFRANTLRADVMDRFGRSVSLNYPVVDAGGTLIGVVTVDSIKDAIAAADGGDSLLAYDLMESVDATATEGMRLTEALDEMSRVGVDYLPVLSADRVAGILEERSIRRYVSKRMLAMQETIDAAS